jgi:sodium transport system permease protein
MSAPRTATFYHATFDPVTAVLVVLAAVGTMYLVQFIVLVAGALDVVAIAAGGIALVGVPIAVARLERKKLAAIGLARPRLRYVVAATLVGIALWYINLRVVVLIAPPEDRQLSALVERPSLAAALVALVVTPAVCEEIVFRGVLARALARRLPIVAAIAIAAAAFALYHLRPIQFLPTFTLGLALGAIAVRGDSAIPGMLGHALNNAMAVVMVRGAAPGLASWLDANPAPALAASIVIVATGVAIAIVPRGGA